MNNLGFATSFGLNVRSTQHLKNVFGDDSDEAAAPEAPKDMVRFQLEQQRKRVEQEMEQAKRDAEKVDPSAFEYDEVFDSMKKEDVKYQEKKQLKQSIRGKPKYVEKLIQEAEKRKLQNGVWYEKKLQREQEVEQQTYGETEKFVTASYKAHLEELKRFEEKQQREEEESTVAGKAGMKGFYASMLGFESAPKKAKSEPEAAVADAPAEAVAPVAVPKHVQQFPVATPTIVAEMPLVSAALDLSSAVGVKDDGGEARRKQLEELNQSTLSEDKVAAARRRYLERKQQQQQQQQNV
jgi:coiled-coil domain-containing protein 55